MENLKVQSDAELVNCVLDGEKEAFAALVVRYERLARAVALDVLGDHHTAQDAVQDAFVTAFRKNCRPCGSARLSVNG